MIHNIDNYRANGGDHFPALTSSRIVFASTSENRQLVADYISKHKILDVKPFTNWHLQLPNKAMVYFTTSNEAEKYLALYPHLHKESSTSLKAGALTIYLN